MECTPANLKFEIYLALSVNNRLWYSGCAQPCQYRTHPRLSQRRQHQSGRSYLGHLYFLLSVANASFRALWDRHGLCIQSQFRHETSGAKILSIFGDLILPLPPEMKTEDHLEDVSALVECVLPKLNLEDCTVEIERMQTMEAKVRDHYQVQAEA